MLVSKQIFNHVVDFIKNRIIEKLTPIQKAVAIVAIASLSSLALSRICRSLLTRKVTTGDLQDDLDHLNSDSPVRISKKSANFYESDRIKKAKEEVEALMENEGFEEAWKRYVQTNHPRTHPVYSSSPNALPSISNWEYLPPENLIKEVLNHLDDTGEILKCMSASFLRDCLLAYPQLRKCFLVDDKIWNCLLSYPDYITDVCLRDQDLAKGVILSARSKSIQYDDFRLNIFEKAYPSIVKSLQNQEIEIEEIKFLTLFLLNYQLGIKKNIFDKIKKLEDLANKLKQSESNQENYEHFYTLLHLVVSKLNNQGVYDREGKNLNYPKIAIDEDFASKFLNSDQMEALIEEISTEEI